MWNDEFRLELVCGSGFCNSDDVTVRVCERDSGFRGEFSDADDAALVDVGHLCFVEGDEGERGEGVAEGPEFFGGDAFEGDGVFDAEAADGGAAEGGEVGGDADGGAEVVGEGADVGASAADDGEADVGCFGIGFRGEEGEGFGAE